MHPSLRPLIGALIAGALGASIVFLLAAVRGAHDTAPVAPSRLDRALHTVGDPALGRRPAAAVIAAAATLIVTRWPVAAAAIALLVVSWPRLFGGARLERQQIHRLEALVMWTEALRDTITARASLEQAIPATAIHAAGPIRPALARLVGHLRARLPLDVALLGLSTELDDASADKVIGALVLNTRQRGSGLAVVLTSLAKAGRDELDQRRRINAGRASMRRSVQLVVAITVVFALLLAVFSRAYVAPYGTPAGQLALILVVGLFAAAFVWLRRLAGGEPMHPFLTRHPDPKTHQQDLLVVHHLTGREPPTPQMRSPLSAGNNQ
jgi:Flp pilus assembly protein TadB